MGINSSHNFQIRSLLLYRLNYKTVSIVATKRRQRKGTKLGHIEYNPKVFGDTHACHKPSKPLPLENFTSPSGFEISNFGAQATVLGAHKNSQNIIIGVLMGLNIQSDFHPSSIKPFKLVAQ